MALRGRHSSYPQDLRRAAREQRLRRGLSPGPGTRCSSTPLLNPIVLEAARRRSDADSPSSPPTVTSTTWRRPARWQIGSSIPFRLHDADAEHLRPQPRRPVVQQARSRLAIWSSTAIHTPGHSPDRSVLTHRRSLFSGDTLFPGGPGATAGPGADFAQIHRRASGNSSPSPDDTLVMPGHGLDTTIGTERPSLPEWRARGW